MRQTYSSARTSRRKQSCRRIGNGPIPLHVNNEQLHHNLKRDVLTRLHIDVLPLHAHEVHDESEEAEAKTDSAAPPDDWRAKKVILRLTISPTAHAQTDAEERPVSWLGREDIFFVRIGNECVVGRHHRNVEVPEVAQER